MQLHKYHSYAETNLFSFKKNCNKGTGIKNKKKHE